MASRRLQNKVAIVTGGAGSFGRAISTLFHNEGATVIVADINLEGATAVAAELGSPAQAFKLDCRRPDSWEQCLDLVLKSAGRLDIVINNAGMVHPKLVAEQVTEELFDQVMDLNVKSIWASVHALVPYFLKEARQGSFVQIASSSGSRPGLGAVWYGCSKGAVITATKGLAAEYGPRGIRFNAVSPDVAVNDMTRRFFGVEVTPEILSPMVSTLPLQRPVTPADVAFACCFLASDEASFITGVNLGVDGGRSI